MEKLEIKWTKDWEVEEAKELAYLCLMSQFQLKSYLTNFLALNYKDVYSGDGYLYAKGDIPILLVAHMDTTPTVTPDKNNDDDDVWYKKGTTYTYKRYYSVDRKPVQYISETVNDKGKHIYKSPQGIGGDDRCGVYTIIRLVEAGYKPYVLFNEDEEIGCIGSEKFCRTEHIEDLKELKFLVQIDRRGSNDAVFYHDDNKEFHEWIEEVTGYVEAKGSCTDIVNLSDACGVSSVNLSSGYYDEHTEYETVCIEELLHTIEAVETLLMMHEEVEQFEFKEYVYISPYYNKYFNYKYGYGYGYGWNWDEEDEEEDDKDYKTELSLYGLGSSLGEEDKDDYVEMQFEWEEDGKRCIDTYSGWTMAECIGKFLIENPSVCWNDVLDYEKIENVA